MIVNATKSLILSRKHKSCKSFCSKALGLMFSSPKCLVFEFEKERKIGLHMLFVFFPIDVLWLNSKKVVVEKATLHPFTFYTPKKKAKYVVELPKGKAKGTRIGDKIVIRNHK